jgi:hypothetical protein
LRPGVNPSPGPSGYRQNQHTATPGGTVEVLWTVIAQHDPGLPYPGFPAAGYSRPGTNPPQAAAYHDGAPGAVHRISPFMPCRMARPESAALNSKKRKGRQEYE